MPGLCPALPLRQTDPASAPGLGVPMGMPRHHSSLGITAQTLRALFLTHSWQSCFCLPRFSIRISAVWLFWGGFGAVPSSPISHR